MIVFWGGESHTKFWVFFKPFFETGKCQCTSPSAPHRAGRECKNFSEIQCTFRFSECSELNQTKVPTYWQLHRHWFFCFQGHVLHSTHIFICFSRQRSWTFSIFYTDHTVFEVRKPLKKHLFLCCLYSESYFGDFKSLHSIFPQFKAKFYVHTLFFQACHFLGTPK